MQVPSFSTIDLSRLSSRRFSHNANLDSDKIIEVALLPFEYDQDIGQVLVVHEDRAQDECRDPGIPIPPESSQVHGITDEMVRGKVVDDTRLTALVADADLIIAHNAAFDRPMLERLWPCFAENPSKCPKGADVRHYVRGVNAIPDEWLEGLELRSVIAEMADDLYAFQSWQLSDEIDSDHERVWRKYPGC